VKILNEKTILNVYLIHVIIINSILNIIRYLALLYGLVPVNQTTPERRISASPLDVIDALTLTKLPMLDELGLLN
jgi:hypothetical protein